MKFYKIKRLTDGKYSRGGSWPRFGLDGTSWTRLRDVKSHLRSNPRYKIKAYEDCVVREYNIDEQEQSLIIRDYNLQDLAGWND